MGFKFVENEAPKSGVSVKLEKGYKVVTIKKVEDKEFDSGACAIKMTTEIDGSTHFLDLFYIQKNGATNNFKEKLINDIVTCSGTSKLVKEFGIEKGLEGAVFGAVLDVEEDNYNDVVKDRYNLLSAIIPILLKILGVRKICIGLLV